MTDMTSRQQAQQNNRDQGGRYATKQHTEADFPDLDDSAAAAAGVPSGVADQIVATGLTDADIEWQFAPPQSRRDMTHNLVAVTSAMNEANRLTGQPERRHWHAGMSVDDRDISEWGFIEDEHGRVVKVRVEDVADWDTHGWGQVAAIHDGIQAAFPGGNVQAREDAALLEAVDAQVRRTNPDSYRAGRVRELVSEMADDVRAQISRDTAEATEKAYEQWANKIGGQLGVEHFDRVSLRAKNRAVSSRPHTGKA